MRAPPIDPRDATALAEEHGVQVTRTSAGELGFLYDAAQELRYVTWSGARAIAEKVALARRLGIRGVALYKLDGNQDPAMWAALPRRAGEGGHADGRERAA